MVVSSRSSQDIDTSSAGSCDMLSVLGSPTLSTIHPIAFARALLSLVTLGRGQLSFSKHRKPGTAASDTLFLEFAGNRALRTSSATGTQGSIIMAEQLKR